MAARVNRQKLLGGTDAAAVLGVSSWTTPVELWQQKVGLAANEPISEERQRMFARGRRLEPFIREMTIQKLRDLGHQVDLVAKNRRYRDAEFPFLSAEIDFELLLDGELINVDAKSVSGFARNKWGAAGTDEIPIEYAAQFMHGLMVSPGERRRCLAAALRSFDDVDIYWTLRDDETIAGMRAKLVEFWTQHVVTKVAPDPVKFGDIRALFPADNSRSIEATPEILGNVARMREIDDQTKSLAFEREQLQFAVAKFMGPHALLTNGVRNVITWEVQQTSRFDVKAFRRQHPDWAALFTKPEATRVMRAAARR